MMSKSVKIVSAACAILLSAVMVTSAQSVNVVSNPTGYYGYIPSYINYMMGTVSVQGSGVVNTQPVLPGIPGPVVNPPVQTPVTGCPAFLTSFHKFGDLSPEVAQLQMFLNQYNGANLNGQGYFGPATMQEVKNFQYAYGINPTGAQYEKTTALINAIKCGTVTPKTGRVVFSGTSTWSPVQAGNNGSVSVGNPAPTNVYPNPAPTTTNPVKVTPPKTTTVNPPMVGKPGTSTATVSNATSSSFSESLKRDFQKIKDNYKAYVLVFVLVLALFWFLRKAATE